MSTDARNAAFTSSHCSPMVTTSWDDGHPLDHRIAELLRQHELSGTFYIPPRSQLATLSPSEVRQLSDDFEIGAHTLDHLALTTLDLAEARRQIRESGDWVQQTTGKACEMFCPPLGKFNQAHIQEMANYGYHGFRSVELLQTDPPKPCFGNSMCSLTTSVQAHPHGRPAFLRNALKRRLPGASWRAITTPQIADWTNLTRRLGERVIRNGGVLHLWGHSWEIEENDQWSQLEETLGWIGEQVAAGRLVPHTNGELAGLQMTRSGSIGEGK